MQKIGKPLWYYRNFLREMGLREDKDFLIFSSPPDVKVFLPDERQMFITGSFWGRNDGVVDMVTTFKKRNPRLTTVFFSANEIASDVFDHYVEKDMDCWERLEEIVQEFLSNNTSRNTLKTL